MSPLCLAPTSPASPQTPLCLWLFLPHSQTAQAKQWFESSSETACTPTVPGRAGSSSLLPVQKLPRRRRRRRRLRASQALPGNLLAVSAQGRRSRLGGVHRVPCLTFGSWVDCKPAGSTMSSTGAVSKALNPSPAAIKSRILLPLQDPSSGSPSSAQGSLLERRMLCPPARTPHPLPYNIKSTTDVVAC